MEIALILILEEVTLFPRGEYYLDEKLMVGIVVTPRKNFKPKNFQFNSIEKTHQATMEIALIFLLLEEVTFSPEKNIFG
jgi:hypothetical protein